LDADLLVTEQLIAPFVIETDLLVSSLFLVVSFGGSTAIVHYFTIDQDLLSAAMPIANS